MLATVQIDQTSLHLLVHALRSEANGKALRRDLRVGLRAAAEPAAFATQVAVLTAPSKHQGKATKNQEDVRSLREVVANAVKVHTSLGSKRPSVDIRAHKAGMPRGFTRAPKYLNRMRPWRHPVFGNRENWVDQYPGHPGWFDDTIPLHRPAFIKAATEAMNNVARRISAKTRG